MSGFDSLKCRDNPCGFCPVATLSDPEKSHAAYAVADVLDDPFYGLSSNLQAASGWEIERKARQVTETVGSLNLQPVIAGALALKAAGACDHQVTI